MNSVLSVVAAFEFAGAAGAFVAGGSGVSGLNSGRRDLLSDAKPPV